MVGMDADNPLMFSDDILWVVVVVLLSKGKPDFNKYLGFEGEDDEEGEDVESGV